MKKIIYEKIYDNLGLILGDLSKIPEYMKLKSGGYMDLNIDLIYTCKDYTQIAMAHNFIQNGDVMADPDMEIRINPFLKMAEALTYQLDSLGLYQVVYPEPGKVYPKLKKQLNIFLLQWTKNLIEQGFKNDEIDKKLIDKKLENAVHKIARQKQ